MRSIKTTVTAVAVRTAGFALTVPAARAATAAPHADRVGCWSAISAAEKAKHDFNAAAEDLKEQIAAGGHPGTAEEQNLEDLKEAAESAVRNAREMCEGMDEHHHHRCHRHPHGAMHTGVGSTSEGVNSSELAGGVGVLGAASAGALVLRRRRRGSAL